MFELYSAEQYRALGVDEMDARCAAIQEELESGETDLETMGEQVRLFKDEKNRRSMAAEMRRAKECQAMKGASVIASYGVKPQETNSDFYDSAEYRSAFMNYVTRGVPMPCEYRSDTGTIIQTPTVTTGVPPQIPSSMQAEIVHEIESRGDIWNRVRKLSVQGGIWFRVLDLKPTATWLQRDSKDELTVSDYQGVTNDATISFSFYELECRMSQSLLAQATTYADFQALFVPAVADAMVDALEAAIISGDGDGQFLGIANDERVTKVAEMSAEEALDWKNWHSMVVAQMGKSYRNGQFIMAQSTFDKYIAIMADDNNAPISIDYDGVTGEPVYRLVGKEVVTVEDTILPDLASATVGDVFAIFGDLHNYVVNTQPGMPMNTVRWIDHDTNTEKIKCLMAADGKVLDPYGFILLKVKASA